MKTQTRPTRPSTRTSTRTRRSTVPPQRRPSDVPEPPAHRGRTALAVAAAVTAAVGLTALVVGVTGGAEVGAPPTPGVPPAIEAPAQNGSDQRLINEAADRLQREQQESAYGSDRRLYNLAESRR